MRNTIDLTKLLKVDDIVWSNAIGDVVKIVFIDTDRYMPVGYTYEKSKGTLCTNKYGYPHYACAPDVITDNAIPDLVPSKDNWNWSTFKRDLPIDTFCVVSYDKRDWRLRHYAGNGTVYTEGDTSLDTMDATKWDYIIPVSKFNFETKEFDEKNNYGVK